MSLVDLSLRPSSLPGACIWVTALLISQALSRESAATADVASLEIVPNGTRVLYTADPVVDDAFELFSVPIAGGTASRLNPPPVAGGDVTTYTASPDSARVAFIGDLDTDEVFELYGASINGRWKAKLDPPLVAGGDVGEFAISTDSRRVVFLADAAVDETFELFSVPIAGGPAVKLNLPLDAAGDVTRFWVAPLGERVVYTADADGTDAFELYSVPIGGGTSIQLSQGISYYPQVVLSSSTEFVVYTTSQFRGLTSVPIAGGALYDLDEPRFVALHSVSIHPDGKRVLYIGDPNDGLDELVSVPITGGPTTTLNAPLDYAKVEEYHVSSDGAWAIYQFENGDANMGLDSVSLDHHRVVELAGPGVTNYSQISPDSTRALFGLYEQGIPYDFWSIPLGGGAPTPLVGVGWYNYTVSADSSFIVTITSGLNPFVLELFSVPMAGGERVRLNPSLVPGGQVQEARISPNSARVAYLADQDVDGMVELYSVPIAGGLARQLNPEFE